jgi:hypothetical protein
MSRLKISGAITPFSLCAFVVWTGTVYLYAYRNKIWRELVCKQHLIVTFCGNVFNSSAIVYSTGHHVW